MERLTNPKRVMANMIASAILIFSIFFTGVAQAQYCEAPTIFENGVRKSTQVTIHSKKKFLICRKDCGKRKLMISLLHCRNCDSILPV